MKEDDIIAVAKFAASLGYKAGYADASDCIKSLTEQAKNPEARKIAQVMALGLDTFAEGAHKTFMQEGLRFKVIFDADGSPTIQ
jgi:hypothetical protein